MDRVAKALMSIDLNGRGLEIGPSYNPLIRKASGARIETVDHTTRENLVAKYRGYGVPAEQIDQIEDVDHLWDGGSLLDVIPEHGAYDYIIASHFIEHTVDLIGFLTDCETLLTENGRLSLVVPDKRFCFDRFQPLSTVGDVVDAHHTGKPFHTAGALVDHQAYGCKKGDALAWSAADTGPLGLQFPNIEEGADVLARALRQDSYSDTHRWKFTETSFALLISDLRVLGFHSLKIIASQPTAGFEFFAALANEPESIPVDRLDALLQIECELAETLYDWKRHGNAATADETLTLQLAVLHGENARLREQIRALETSSSWRVTRPLRAAANRARQLRAR